MRIVSAILAWVLMATGSASAARPVEYRLEIPAGPADVALKTLAKKTGKSLLFDYRDVARVQSNALIGRFTLEEALARLLDGTGLAATLTQGDVIAVSPARAGSGRKRAANGTGNGRRPGAMAFENGSKGIRGRESGRPDVFAIEEVIVTARRFQEDLQDTPVSVSASSGAALERRHIVNAQDLDRIVPNLQFAATAPLSGNNSASQIFIRGIGQTDPTAGIDPGVGLYIDGIYFGQSVGRALDLRDVARVQVLRGPQGTLFGRNTIGGAILIETVDPGDELAGQIRAEAGSDNLREVFLALDVPLGDTLKTRFTWGLRDRDGYVRRTGDGLDLGDDHSYKLSLKALWAPVPKLRLTFKGDYLKEDENGTPLVFAAINEAAAVPRIVSERAGCPGMLPYPDSGPVPQIDDARCANDFWNDGPHVTSGTFPLESGVENWGVALTADWTISGHFALKSISSYRALRWSGNRDADNTPFRILHTEYRSKGDQFSEEIQGTYQHDRITGVVGVFYYEENIDDRLRVSLWELTPPRATRDSNDNIVKNRSWAAFTQWTYALSDALKIAGGIRYTTETKGSKPDQFNYDAPDMPYVTRTLFKKDFDAVTGSASVQYQWNETAMTYASWAQGFKSGGFNSRFNNPIPGGEPPAFDEEKAETIEVGLKLSPIDRLRLNGALFTTEYDNLQFTYRIGFAPFLFNAGKALIRGFEWEFQFVPVSSLILEGGVGYLDGEIKKVAEIVGATTSVTTDSRLPYTPNWQANLGIAYSFRPITGAVVTPRIAMSYTGKQFFDAGNTPEISQTQSVTVWNASIAVEIPQGHWRLVLGVDNFTDEIFPVAGNSSLTTGSGYAEIAYARGREWYMRIAKEF